MTASISTGRIDRVVYLGAEAVIAEGEFLGYRAVFKLRLRKPYRDPELDQQIVSRRTIAEVRNLLTLREHGVRVPRVLFVDPLEGLIVMEKIDGVVLRDALGGLDRDAACHVMRAAGVEVGKVHRAGIAHGDVTTSNMVLTSSGEVYLLDLGLAKRVEDLEDIAVDIHLLIRVLESSHYSSREELLRCFLRGYREVLSEEMIREVLSKVGEIRMRGRYVEERRIRKSN